MLRSGKAASRVKPLDDLDLFVILRLLGISPRWTPVKFRLGDFGPSFYSEMGGVLIVDDCNNNNQFLYVSVIYIQYYTCACLYYFFHTFSRNIHTQYKL